MTGAGWGGRPGTFVRLPFWALTRLRQRAAVAGKSLPAVAAAILCDAVRGDGCGCSGQPPQQPDDHRHGDR